MRKLKSITFFASMWMVIACGTVWAQERVEFKKDKIEAKVGESKKVDAVYYNESGKKVKVNFTWRVEPSTLGTIDNTGRFRAAAAGNGTIYAQYGEQTGSVEVQVTKGNDNNNNDENDQSRIEINEENIEITVGQTKKLKADYYDESGKKVNVSFTWRVEPSTVGTIDNTGRFTAATEGSGTIYAQYGEQTGSVEVQVTKGNDNNNDDDGDENDQSRIEINEENIEITVGQTKKLKADYYDESGKKVNVSFTWRVEPSSLGTIDNTGRFTAAVEGNGTIYAEYGEKIASVEVQVEKGNNNKDDDDENALPRVDIRKEEIKVNIGETKKIQVNYLNESGEEVDVLFTWRVEPPTLGTIDESGLFSAEIVGKGLIYAQYEDCIDSVKVEIEEADDDDENVLPRVEIRKEEIEVKVGETKQVQAIYLNESGEEVDVLFSWRIEPPTLGTIDETGLFSAEIKGKGFIYAQYGDCIDSVKVDIEEEDDDDDETDKPRVMIRNDEIGLKVGETERIEAYYLDESGNEVANEFECYVVPPFLGNFDDTGLFTAEHPGNGQIFVKTGKIKAHIKVRVEKEKHKENQQDYPFIEIVTNKVNVTTGDSVQLLAIYTDELGNEADADIVWSVEPSNLGYFSTVTNGLFLAEIVGNGTITASVGDLNDVVEVKVHIPEEDDDDSGSGESEYEKRLVIDPPNLIVEIGTSIQYVARFMMQDTTLIDTIAQWSISGDSVGTISEEGILDVQAVGVAVIQAQVEDKIATTTVTVRNPSAPDEVINTVLISRVLPDGHILPEQEVQEDQVYIISGLPYPLDILNGAQIYFPKGSLHEDIVLHILLPQSAGIQGEDELVVFEDGSIAGIRFQVVVDDVPVEPYNFDIPLNLSIPFNRDQLEEMGLTPEDLGLFFVNEGATYESAGIFNITVDEVTNKIYAKVAHFSTLVIRDKSTIVTAIETKPIEISVPVNFDLEQNYPNPFNPTTTIRYYLPEQSHVSLTIYDYLGCEIRTLVHENKSEGVYSAVWDGKNDFGEQAASGVYLYRLRVNGQNVSTRKMLLIK